MRIRRLAPIVPMILVWAGCADTPAELGGADQEGSSFVANDAQSMKQAEELGLQHIRQQPELLRGVGDVSIKRVLIDEQGEAHSRVAQSINGIPVLGGEAIVHLNTDGSLKSITDHLLRGVTVSTTPELRKTEAVDSAVAEAGGWNLLKAEPKADLQIVRHEGTDHLVYRVELDSVSDEGEPSMPVVFVDAHRGHTVWSYDNLETSKNRKTYTANTLTSLPGTLVRSEGGAASSDAVLNQAHDNAGFTYDFYWNVLGRDSYNGAGATITSTVHYSKNYVNAFWNGTQMVYGDGDGTQSGPLTVLDVVGHELTHAVTETSSGLIYSNESGALNEAMSDIFGASIEAYRDGAVSGNTWKVGEECWTPGTAGDALRYMNDPATAGDYDYYPTRYTGTSDNGGVHWNSGIANLAFYLAVAGGSHPRGKTSVVVPALDANSYNSIMKGAAIFYRANTQCLTPSSTFADARSCTVAAATDLYGSAAAASVAAAWDAVGVGAAPTWITLDTKSNLSGKRSATVTYSYATPSGATQIQFATSGGSGDVDLYVKFGSAPTTSSYDCRPYASGNNETCTFNPAKQGTYYVMLRGYSAYSGVTLTTKYSQ